MRNFGPFIMTIIINNSSSSFLICGPAQLRLFTSRHPSAVYTYNHCSLSWHILHTTSAIIFFFLAGFLSFFLSRVLPYQDSAYNFCIYFCLRVLWHTAVGKYLPSSAFLSRFSLIFIHLVKSSDFRSFSYPHFNSSNLRLSVYSFVHITAM